LRDRDIDFSLIQNDAARHCISRLLDKNPETRATIDELIKDEWITRSGEEPLEFDYMDGEKQLKFRRPSRIKPQTTLNMLPARRPVRLGSILTIINENGAQE
jgi:serine/threonine protein kinase